MERTQKTRSIWRAGIGVAFLALAVVAVWRLWPRERLLTEVARPILKEDKDNQHMFWLTARRLLIVTDRPDAGLTDSSAPIHWRTSVELLDTTTHVRTPLAGLTNLLNHTPQATMSAIRTFTASPDGAWLLWEVYGPGDNPYLNVACLDGSHYRRWTDSISLDNCFFEDAYHLVVMTDFGPMMTVCDLRDPTSDQTYVTAKQASPMLADYAVQQPFYVILSYPDHTGNHAEVEIETYRMQDRLHLLHSGGYPDQEPQPLHRHKLKLPEYTVFPQESVSPQTGEVSSQMQSVFYCVQHSQKSPLVSWLQRLIPTFDMKPVLTEALWVSQADGGGLHEIGYVPTTLDAYGNVEGQLYNIEWLPDGKQISFVYNGTLYVVPAVPGK